MAVANRYVGKDLQVNFDTGGGTQILSGDQTEFSVSWTIQGADVTAATDGGVEEKPTLEDISASLTIFHTGSGGTAVWQAVRPGVEGTILFGPKGTAAGQPKASFRAYIQSKPISVPFNEGVVRAVEIRGQGTMIDKLDTDVWP